ncbi:hypothetical protein LCGC14_2992550, partial [marine sediment metagenome]
MTKEITGADGRSPYQKSKHTNLPVWFWLNADLPARAKLLYQALTFYEGVYRTMPHLTQISEMLEWNRKTTTKHLVELEEIGLVYIEYAHKKISGFVLQDPKEIFESWDRNLESSVP